MCSLIGYVRSRLIISSIRTLRMQRLAYNGTRSSNRIPDWWATTIFLWFLFSAPLAHEVARARISKVGNGIEQMCHPRVQLTRMASKDVMTRLSEEKNSLLKEHFDSFIFNWLASRVVVVTSIRSVRHRPVTPTSVFLPFPSGGFFLNTVHQV